MKLLEKLNEIAKQCNIELKDTSIELMYMLRDCGIQTGSTLFGVGNSDSDIDVILPSDKMLNWDYVIMHYNGIYISEGDDSPFDYYQKDFKSCYVFYKGVIYNLLFMHNDKAYRRWIIATAEMQRRAETDAEFKKAIVDKEFRVKMFEEFKRNAVV